MKSTKRVSIVTSAFLFIFGLLFAWEVRAQDDANSEGRTTIYLPWISGSHSQIQAATVSTHTVETSNVTNNDSAFLPGAESYVAKYKVSLEEALYRLKLQSSIGDLNAKLETAESKSFAGLWIEHEPIYKVVIQFTHDAEKTLEPYLPDISFTHLIEVQTATISVQELQKIHDRIVEKINALESAVDSIVQADSAVNIMQNRIDIFVTEPEAVDWSAILGDDSKYVAIVKIDVLPFPTADIRAGYFFDDLSCTIGWNVTYAGGRYASTAYHCSNILYQGNTLSTRVGWYGSTSDLELFYPPSRYSLPNRWQQGWGSNVVTIERSKSQTAIGQWLYHIGAATTWQCGNVFSKNYNWTGGNTWVGVHFLTCPGDSGGPVLTDVQAYGMIVAGNCSTFGIYMPLDEFWSRGVHVATTP